MDFGESKQELEGCPRNRNNNMMFSLHLSWNKKSYQLPLGAYFLLFFNITSSAAVHYVDSNSTNPVAPYTVWETAATNIQDAVDVSALSGDLVLVTNGIYQAGSKQTSDGTLNRVAVTNSVMLQSVNGPSVTFIDGTKTVRCAYLASNAFISGFTLTNGVGGGVVCQDSSEIVSNCIISGNSATDGGGVTGGTVIDSFLGNNAATLGSGGGANASTLINCTLQANVAPGLGGGASVSTLSNCTLLDNIASSSGGGAYRCTLNNCVILGNQVYTYNGTAGGAAGSTLNNCLVAGNSANQAGGTLLGSLKNCTVVGNSAQYGGGGCYDGTLQNCIVYYNNTGGNYQHDSLGISLDHCCTTPLPTGAGNFTNEPAFINLATGNYRLQTNSPCINSGLNLNAPMPLDLDNNQRIVGGSVDMGAYEYQTPASTLSYAWAQQYGLPTDGSADYSDADGDGANNWEEWQAGTNPTNSLSVLKILGIATTNYPSTPTIIWQSVTGVTYYIQRSSDLSVQPAFSAIKSNIIGAAGTTSLTDGTATNDSPYFYRVGVQ